MLTTPYPIQNDGKPYLDTVWLEVTSHCNQKCTFCPDPMRESKREFMDLKIFKRIIDELSTDFHVGHLELNAYGEPLLHPQLYDMIDYIRYKKLSCPFFMTTHGLTLSDKRIQKLTKHYPDGIAVSLQNHNAASYATTRSLKLGNYDILVERIFCFLKVFLKHKPACNIRLYLLINNDKTFFGVPQKVLNSFPNQWQDFQKTVRFWEEKLKPLATKKEISFHESSDQHIKDAFEMADQDVTDILHLLRWQDHNNQSQSVYLSPRPITTYSNLLPDRDPDWLVVPRTFSFPCPFTARPSLAVFANLKLGACCIDLEGTATFGSFTDFKNLKEAIYSKECNQFFGALKKGILSKKQCQICIGSVFNKSQIEESSEESLREWVRQDEERFKQTL